MILDITSSLTSLPEAVKILAVFVCAALALLIIKLIKRFIKGSDGESSDSSHSPSSLIDASKMSLPNPAPLHPEDERRLRERIARIGAKLTLVDTDEKTAAVIMAITSHKLGVPLDRLLFSSIKCVEKPIKLEGVTDPEAAVVMALTSYRTGIPLENLTFNSIKLIK